MKTCSANPASGGPCVCLATAVSLCGEPWIFPSALFRRALAFLKLPLAFKVGVLHYYGLEWLPRTSQWILLGAGAVLGHGAAEAAFRAATEWPERFQVQVLATRAGMVRQQQVLKAWLRTNRVQQRGIFCRINLSSGGAFIGLTFLFA